MLLLPGEEDGAGFAFSVPDTAAALSAARRLREVDGRNLALMMLLPGPALITGVAFRLAVAAELARVARKLAAEAIDLMLNRGSRALAAEREGERRWESGLEGE